MKRIVFFAAIFALLLSAAACDSSPKPTATKDTQAQSGGASAPAAGATQALSGRVLEVMQSGGYTYLQVETAGGPKWAAVPANTAATKGEKISLAEGMVMQNFHSKTLNRDFAEIVFSSGVIGQAEAAPARPSAPAAPAEQKGSASSSFQDALRGQSGKTIPEAAVMPPGDGGSKKAAPTALTVKVPKAEGADAYTVAEIHTQGAKLAGKKIRLRGAVAKVSKNIMGRHWVHIQDGSGKAEGGTHDLTVTTNQTPPELNDIVVVSGVLASNKDFGAGYSYVVILEDAAFSPSKAK